jgi:polysaccharide export outer membrane protein
MRFCLSETRVCFLTSPPAGRKFSFLFWLALFCVYYVADGVVFAQSANAVATNALKQTALAATNQSFASSLYTIAPNDVVWLKVYQEDDLDVRTKVAGDGTITLPLLGAVQVAGKSVAQVSKEIRDELDRRFIVNPQLSFSVVEFSKRKFTVLGQVQRPGIYEYSGDERMTLLQALALAGGFTRMASPSKVTVKRVEGSQVKTFSLKNEADPKNPAAVPFEIRPGDTINVGARIL